MLKNLKTIFSLYSFLVFFISGVLSAQDGNSVSSAQLSSEDEISLDDEFDSLFEDSVDVEEPVQSEEKKEKHTITIGTDNFKIPLRFSGHLEAECGLGYVNEDGSSSATGGLKFKNDLNFNTRIDKTLAIKATMRTESGSWQFSVYEMYFDYVLLSHLYITAGKKNTSWGNIRILNDTDEFENDPEALSTNLLYDSRDGTSMQLRLPLGNFCFTAFLLYKGENVDKVGQDEMSVAGSIEVVIGKTSFNFFGRKFPSADSEIVLKKKDKHIDPVVGAEVKRTILGFDLYAQQLAYLGNKAKLKEFGKAVIKNEQLHNTDLEGFSKLIFSGGFYRIWETSGPDIGFNFEFQDVYTPAEKDHSKKVAFQGAVSKLGKGKNIAIGTTWKHYTNGNSGEIEPGIVLSGIFPNAKWKNGAEIKYGENYDRAKITVATTLLINVDY